MATYRPTPLHTNPAPPFRPHTPDPEHEAKLSHHTGRVHRVEEAMRQMLFGNAKIKRRASDERVHDLQQKEAKHYSQITTPPESPKETAKTDTASPSRQAADVDKVNQNGMDDEDSWGWPGLGTWHGFKAEGAIATKQKRSSSSSTGRTDERALAAMREAADEAAGESYGWAGLGSWPSSKS